MPYTNTYRFADYDEATSKVTFTDNTDAEFMVGESQKDVTVRRQHGEMIRLHKSKQTPEEAVILFAKLLIVRDK